MKIGYYIILCIIVIYVPGCDKSSDVKDGLPHDEYINMALQYESNSDNEKAISAYKKALEIKPQDADTHYALGRLYDAEAQRSYADAFNKYQLERLTGPQKKQNKDQTKILEELGFKKEYETLAIKEFKETIKYDPEHWLARYLIATYYFNNKLYKEAIEEYNHVIKINHKYSSAYKLLGESYLKVGACNMALDNFKKAYELDSSADSYYCDAGRVYIKMKNANKAKEMFDKLKGAQYYYKRLKDYQFEPHGECMDQ
jgi:tetratricopeptide (TPR) repeat protein